MSMLALDWRMGIEVAIFAPCIYLVLRFLRETRGSGVVRGLTFLLVVGLITFVTLIEWLELQRLRVFFLGARDTAILGLVIVFQPEIRRAILNLGEMPLFGRFLKREVRFISRLIRSVARMSRDHIGALIAIERSSSLSTLAETGITLDAELNSYLIESVFYPGNSLHDGAIIIRDNRIVAASCLLPLSSNPEVDKRLGTRHRAALGLSEETDALVLVVSEETGSISVAVGGKLHHGISLEELEQYIEGSADRRGGKR
ncbi:MAG: diadenylate cyclase CdaA [Planctomycetes bacterium]|nr:diadenylate cyclase CdaA [Planctomycetota bacterium]